MSLTREALLRDACERRDAAEVRRLLERHEELRHRIDEPVFAFNAPAIVACADDPAMVDVLLDFGADPNRKSDWWAGGFHALYAATGSAADRLIDAGATVDACAAAHLDRADLLRDLMARDPGVVHMRGAGRDELARCLVERGAETDVFLAAALGLTDVARSLLRANPALLDLRTGQGEYGERPPSSYQIYFWTIGANQSPLAVAAQFEQPDTLDAMLAFATPKARFLLACRQGDEATARRMARDEPALIPSLTPDDNRALADTAWNGDARAVTPRVVLSRIGARQHQSRSRRGCQGPRRVPGLSPIGECELWGETTFSPILPTCTSAERHHAAVRKQARRRFANPASDPPMALITKMQPSN